MDLKMPLENGGADERVSRGQASERAVCVCEAVSGEKGACRPPLPPAVVCPPGRRRRRRLAILHRSRPGIQRSTNFREDRYFVFCFFISLTAPANLKFDGESQIALARGAGAKHAQGLAAQSSRTSGGRLASEHTCRNRQMPGGRLGPHVSRRGACAAMPPGPCVRQRPLTCICICTCMRM